MLQTPALLSLKHNFQRYDSRGGCRRRHLWHLISNLVTLSSCITPTLLTLPTIPAAFIPTIMSMSAFTVKLHQIDRMNLMTLSRGPDQPPSMC